MSNLNSGTFPVFPAFEKNMAKFSVKIPWQLDIILLIRSILLFFITCDNYDYNLLKLFKVLHEKIQKVTLCVLRL